jgi:hypothetical protein
MRLLQTRQTVHANKPRTCIRSTLPVATTVDTPSHIYLARQGQPPGLTFAKHLVSDDWDGQTVIGCRCMRETVEATLIRDTRRDSSSFALLARSSGEAEQTQTRTNLASVKASKIKVQQRMAIGSGADMPRHDACLLARITRTTRVASESQTAPRITVTDNHPSDSECARVASIVRIVVYDWGDEIQLTLIIARRMFVTNNCCSSQRGSDFS